jgi:mannose-1-phosphate guanylyltransferase
MTEFENSDFKKIAVIMAGGSNVMLWPKATEKFPKQFLRLLSNESMVESTYNRLLPYFEPENIYVVTSDEFANLINQQIPLLPDDNIIIEPFAKHTAPCLALTLSVLQEKYDENTIIMAFPADHYILNVREFQNSLDLAGKVALHTDGIVTIGIQPTRPETKYGYVQIKSKRDGLNDFYDMGVRKSSTFAEKPDIETAKRFVKSGDFLWNSGIFIMSIKRFWQAFEEHLPEHFKLFDIIKRTAGKDVFKEAVKEAYMQMESVSMDYAILEKDKNVYVVESYFSWSDLGDWDEIYRLSRKDARNNVLIGDVVALGVKNSLILSNERMIGIAGVDNLIVIDTKDALLICKKGDSERVQDIVDFLRRKQINHYL